MEFEMAGKTIAEHLAALKATREDVNKKLRDLAQKSIDEERSLETVEQKEFDDLKAQLKSLDEDIKRFSELETAQAASAKPVDDSAKSKEEATVSSAASVHTLQVKNTQKLDPGVAFARLARVKALAFTGQTGSRNEVDIAKHIYPGDDKLVASLQAKAAVNAANTLTGNDAWAGNMIIEGGGAFADFVEYLRPRTLVGQVSDRMRRLPFDTPVLVQGSGGSAKWVKEGAAKPLTEWTYSRAKLQPLKVAAIAAATKETLMRASAAADLLLRDELARAVGSRIDTTFISEDAAVTDESPAGILNGATELTLTGDGTIAGIRCDIAAFLQSMATNNLSVAGSFWVMPETLAIDLSLVANEVGAPGFPGITPTGGTLAGIPVFTSQYVPQDSAGPVVALIKGDEVFLGDEGGIQVSVSDQASLVMDDSPSMNSTTPTAAQVVSMWQTNSVAFLVERFLNFQKRRAQAVVWGQVNWSACQ